MKAIIILLFAVCIGCSSSTDSNTSGNGNTSNDLSANPDLTGSWDVHYSGGGKNYDNTESITTSGSRITYQGKSYNCSYNGSNVSWDYSTSAGDYGYDITMTSKDAFTGSSYVEIGSSTTRLSMSGRRR